MKEKERQADVDIDILKKGENIFSVSNKNSYTPSKNKKPKTDINIDSAIQTDSIKSPEKEVRISSYFDLRDEDTGSQNNTTDDKIVEENVANNLQNTNEQINLVKKEKPQKIIQIEPKNSVQEEPINVPQYGEDVDADKNFSLKLNPYKGFGDEILENELSKKLTEADGGFLNNTFNELPTANDTIDVTMDNSRNNHKTDKDFNDHSIFSVKDRSHDISNDAVNNTTNKEEVTDTSNILKASERSIRISERNLDINGSRDSPEFMPSTVKKKPPLAFNNHHTLNKKENMPIFSIKNDEIFMKIDSKEYFKAQVTDKKIFFENTNDSIIEFESYSKLFEQKNCEFKFDKITGVAEINPELTKILLSFDLMGTKVVFEFVKDNSNYQWPKKSPKILHKELLDQEESLKSSDKYEFLLEEPEADATLKSDSTIGSLGKKVHMKLSDMSIGRTHHKKGSDIYIKTTIKKNDKEILQESIDFDSNKDKL